MKALAEVQGIATPIAVARTGFRLQGGDPEATIPPLALGADTDAVLGSLG